MAADSEMESLERVKQIATLAGLKGEIDSERKHFHMGFLLPEDRRQRVFVRDTSTEKRRVVTFFSPCKVLEKGLASGLTKDAAIELLKANEKLPFARYGVWETEGALTVVASFDCLLDTLDPEEFHNAAWSVAFTADMYERRQGEDRF